MLTDAELARCRARVAELAPADLLAWLHRALLIGVEPAGRGDIVRASLTYLRSVGRREEPSAVLSRFPWPGACDRDLGPGHAG